MSGEQVQIYKASLIKVAQAQDFAQMTEIVQYAHEQSTSIINSAQIEAQRLLSEARTEAEKSLADARLQADQLMNSIAEQEHKRASDKAIGDVLRLTTQLMQDIHHSDAAIVELVGIVMERILGMFTEKDLLERLVVKATHDLRDKYGFKLCVHPAKYSLATEVISQIKAQMNKNIFPIQDVISSDSISPDEYQLISATGAIDISLKGQIDRILKEIKSVPTYI